MKPFHDTNGMVSGVYDYSTNGQIMNLLAASLLYV